MSAGFTDALVGFAASGWAFRAGIRGVGRSWFGAALVRAGAAPFAAAAPLDAAFAAGWAGGGDGDVTLPAAVAATVLGVSAAAPGAAVLDAALAGAEIALRVSAALGPDHLARGWDPCGSAGRIGAAAAGARVLGLQRAPFRDALGLAATAAAGVRDGAATARFVAASAAADGVEAALLARAGLTAAAAPIEGRRGLAALTTASFDAAAGIDVLGERFLLAERPSLALPPPLADALLALDRAPGLDALLAALDATSGSSPSPGRSS